MMEQDKRATFEQEIKELRASLTKALPRELTRDECMKAQILLESLKMEIHKKMFDAANFKGLPQPALEAMATMEKMRADDKFFNEMGFEGIDVSLSFERLSLWEDKELHGIIESS